MTWIKKSCSSSFCRLATESYVDREKRVLAIEKKVEKVNNMRE